MILENKGDISDIHETIESNPIIKNIINNEFNKREMSDDGVYIDEDERIVPLESLMPDLGPKEIITDVDVSFKLSTYLADIFSHITDTDDDGNYLLF